MGDVVFHQENTEPVPTGKIEKLSHSFKSLPLSIKITLASLVILGIVSPFFLANSQIYTQQAANGHACVTPPLCVFEGKNRCFANVPKSYWCLPTPTASPK